jgi:hypothetical protein
MTSDQTNYLVNVCKGPLSSSTLPQDIEELCCSQTKEVASIKPCTEDKGKYVKYLEEVGIHSEKQHPVRSYYNGAAEKM